MTIASVNYYFGRLNLISAYSDKEEFLLNSLRKGVVIDKRDFEWGFFNVSVILMDGVKFYSGYLTKYKSQKEEDTVDEVKKQLSKTTIQNRAIASSIFFLQPITGIIAYHPRPGIIGINQFKEIFSELIETANDHIMVDAEIQSIDEELEILEAIRKFDKITSLFIELHPSNPHNRQRWKKTDERLQRMKVERYKQHYQSDKGLIVDPEDDAYGDILMAADGYGRADIIGEKDNKESTASTEKIPMKTKGLNEGEPIAILESIINTFKSIWDRMRD